MREVTAVTFKAAFKSYKANNKKCKFTMSRSSGGLVGFHQKDTNNFVNVRAHLDTMNCGLMHISGINATGGIKVWNFIFGYIDQLARTSRKWGILYNTSSYQRSIKEQLVKHNYRAMGERFINYNSRATITFHIKQING